MFCFYIQSKTLALATSRNIRLSYFNTWKPWVAYYFINIPALHAHNDNFGKIAMLSKMYLVLYKANIPREGYWCSNHALIDAEV